MPCVFCKIVAWETPSQRVYEDDKFIAFLDINPVNFGHTLIIPRKHYANFTETPEEVLSGMVKLAKKIAPAVLQAMNAPAYNVTFNSGEEAGQAVHHVHLHIIPRWATDGHKAWQGRSRYAEGGMGETAKKIKSFLAN